MAVLKPCPFCGANQLPFSEEQYAEEAWNKRAPAADSIVIEETEKEET